MTSNTSTPGAIVELTSEEFTTGGRVLVAKTEWFQTLRLELPQGKSVPNHHAKGPITVQCLHGCVHFFVEDKPHELKAGSWLFLEPLTEHSLLAMEDSAVLVTKISA